MIKKQELLRLLKKALDTEEKSIKIYMRHLESAVFWTGIAQDKAKEAKKLLNSLTQGSASHKEIVEGMINRVEREEKDAF